MRGTKIIGLCILLYVIMQGCIQKHDETTEREKHLFERKIKDKMNLYIDRVSSDKVLRKESSDSISKFVFSSFRMSFEDSSLAGKPVNVDLNRYFQYEMQRDWKLILHGDSIPVAFFQPVENLNAFAKEAVIVFEIPVNTVPDTLVYSDSYGTWGNQMIILNEKK